VSEHEAPRPRNRAGTERSLLLAVAAVLTEDGPSRLSLSAVARRAGVDKALVYRYFDSFAGLLEAYARDSLYWPTLDEVAPDRAELLALPIGKRFSVVMQRYAAALRARPDTLAILATELAERGAFQSILERQRERFGEALFSLAHDAPKHVDVAAIATLLTGSIHYLLIRARQVEVFNGIALSSDAGWARIDAALTLLLEGAVRTSPPEKRRRRRASAQGAAGAVRGSSALPAKG